MEHKDQAKNWNWREGSERDHTKRDLQLAAILKSRFGTMNTVHLESGQCELLDLTQADGAENASLEDYERYFQKELEKVHPDDRAEFQTVLALDHLRKQAAGTEDFEEEVCLYRLRSGPERWIERRVIYSRAGEQVMVNILGQDVTRQKQQEQARLRTLEDRAYIISSLSSLFFSTYYIDLEQDTFRPVVQLRRVEDVLGDEVNYSAGLQIYANHFIHPDDRAEYLRVMNVENLRESLRWWQPYEEVEYRLLPEEPDSEGNGCRWVRATAALARTGEDDRPKTAVYVAQDITGGKHRAAERRA